MDIKELKNIIIEVSTWEANFNNLSYYLALKKELEGAQNETN